MNEETPEQVLDWFLRFFASCVRTHRGIADGRGKVNDSDEFGSVRLPALLARVRTAAPPADSDPMPVRETPPYPKPAPGYTIREEAEASMVAIRR